MKKSARLVFSIVIYICVLFVVGMVVAVTFNILDPVVSNLVENDVARVTVLTGSCWFVAMVILMAVPFPPHGYYWYLRFRARNENSTE